MPSNLKALEYSILQRLLLITMHKEIILTSHMSKTLQINQTFLAQGTNERTGKTRYLPKAPWWAMPARCSCCVLKSQHILFWLPSSLLTRAHFQTSSSPAASSTRHPTQHCSDRQSNRLSPKQPLPGALKGRKPLTFVFFKESIALVWFNKEKEDILGSQNSKSNILAKVSKGSLPCVIPVFYNSATSQEFFGGRKARVFNSSHL